MTDDASGWTTNAIPMGADEGIHPPYTPAQQDAQLQALRFAWCELAGVLHARGVLGLQALEGALGHAQWIYRQQPQTLRAVEWLADTLGYMRAKSGAAGCARSGSAGNAWRQRPARVWVRTVRTGGRTAGRH